jgi:hypothetical protein
MKEALNDVTLETYASFVVKGKLVVRRNSNLVPTLNRAGNERSIGALWWQYINWTAIDEIDTRQ